MSPPWELIVKVFNGRELHKIKDEDSKANGWRGEDPAELPPGHWVISNHVFDSIVEPLDSVAPRDRYAFKEDQEEKTKK